jgi:hypothetical protein
MITIAIDPGVHKCACSALVDGALESAPWFEAVVYGGTHSHAPRPLSALSTEIAVEQPEYQGDRSDKAKTQVLLALAWHGAMLAGQFAGRDQAPVFNYPVHEWKGSASKPMHHHAIWAQLTPAERRLLGGDKTAAAIDKACEKGALDRWRKEGVRYYPRTFETHNLLDSVGLCMHHTGRFRIV